MTVSPLEKEGSLQMPGNVTCTQRQLDSGTSRGMIGIETYSWREPTGGRS